MFQGLNYNSLSNFQFLILGYHMRFAKKKEEGQLELQRQDSLPKLSSSQEASPPVQLASRHLAFEKNYPKNIFIPLIEYLSQRGLRQQYEACVGTRQSFQGKNVVSLAEIHRVMSQQWFSEGINLTALVSNMSNKILMNSKIKKKLFHLLLIRQIFTIPLEDAREFKKLVSKRANQVSQSILPDDPLFAYPSALIYLLSLFAQVLSRDENGLVNEQLQILGAQDESKKYLFNQQQSAENRLRGKEGSSKQEYKFYISKIITTLNSFQGDSSQLSDLIQEVKARISERQQGLKQKYKLPPFVPEWSYFNRIVVNSCYLYKRNRQKLTFSLLNLWIQQFKEKSTSLRGFQELVGEGNQEQHQFKPIVLIHPPPQ